MRWPQREPETKRWSAFGRALVLGTVLLAGPARAHDFWIEPSTFDPGAGTAVSIDLKVGEEFIGDSVPHRAETTDFFVLHAGNEKDRPISGADGLSPAGTIVADGRRTTLIAYSGTGGSVTLPADRFERYLESYGLEWVIRERAIRRETLQPGRENFYRHARTLLSGIAADPTLPGHSLGQTLEILVDGDPTQGNLPVVTGRVLWRGNPLAGGLLIARQSADPRHPQSVRTASDGRFLLPLQHGGIWLLQIVWMERAG